MDTASVPAVGDQVSSACSAEAEAALSIKEGESNQTNSLKLVRWAGWILLAIVGSMQAWYERHRLFSDGLSYLEIAGFYAKGDWHSALNSYWSPLYSCVVAVFMVLFRPRAYWHVALLHLVNLIGYLLSLAALEVFIDDIVKVQRRAIGPHTLSATTLRIVSYSGFLIATLLLVNLGYVSPDLIAMAIQFYLLHVLMQINSEPVRLRAYVFFGVVLGLGYLCRAAFAPFIAIYIALAALLLRKRNVSPLKPLGVTLLLTILVAGPFVTALSISKGRFTLGDAGKLNYGWEIDGAARWVHWQGEPGDIGVPLHPTHKVLDSPATYTFASPVPGTYPPWYEPSFWYEGIKPDLKIKPQLDVLIASSKVVAYLLLRSPVTIPVLFLAFLMGWRKWFSKRGILAFWFVLMPTIIYIFGYMVVYIDPRYIAGSLLVIWICLLASVSIPGSLTARGTNRVLQELGILFAVVVLASRLEAPIRGSIKDLIHLRETDWNLNWMLADAIHKLGAQKADRVAWIGQGIDSEWARIAGVKIVAEVPVTYVRDNTLLRRIDWGDRKNVNSFWFADSERKARVLQAFRQAGATIVVADKIPLGADATGWQRVLPEKTPHLASGLGQSDYYKRLRFLRIAPVPQAAGRHLPP